MRWNYQVVLAFILGMATSSVLIVGAITLTPMLFDGGLSTLTRSPDKVPAWITDPAARIRVKEHARLKAEGVHWLATVLIEIHKALYRYEPWHDDDTARVETLKMMFEVWAKMPAPKDRCPSRDSQGHQVCP